MVAQLEKEGVPKKSPFTISLSSELKWATMTTREKPSRDTLLNCSDSIESFCKDLAVVGVIGSVQAQRIYLNNDKRRLNKLTDLQFIKKHEFIRGKNIIPIYTLGAAGMHVVFGNLEQANIWKTYNTNDVLKKLVFFQLYGGLNNEDAKISLLPAEGPFTAVINRNEKEFHVLVVRGNENEINNFFRYESGNIPSRILIVVEELNHLNPIQNILKPYVNRIRVTTDQDLNASFAEMFYQFKDNQWQKENL